MRKWPGGGCGRAVLEGLNLGLDAGVGRAALNHPVGVLLPHGVSGERARLAGRSAE